MYYVVKCSRCGNVFLTTARYGSRWKRTARCPRCGHVERLDGYRLYMSREEALRARNKVLGID